MAGRDLLGYRDTETKADLGVGAQLPVEHLPLHMNFWVQFAAPKSRAGCGVHMCDGARGRHRQVDARSSLSRQTCLIGKP